MALMYKLYKAIGLSYYNKEDGRKKANELLNKKVQNPYDPTSTSLLIDVLLNTTMDAKAIKNVFDSYGIEQTKNGVDITGNSSLEYMLYHGKKYHYKANGENLTIDENTIHGEGIVPDVLPIISKSHLEHIQHLVSSSKEGFNSYYGQAAEFSIKRQLEEVGYKTFLPTDRNVEAVDIYVSKDFFNDYGISYVEHPNKPNFGMLQIKTTSSLNPTVDYKSNTINHFEKNPEIPVLASSKIANGLEEKYSKDMIIGFDKIGLDELGAEKEIYSQLQAVRNIHGESLIEQFNLPTGANISTPELDAIKDSSMLFGDAGLDSIPLLGISLSISFSSYSNYRRIKNKEISVKQGLKNISSNGIKTAVISTTSIAASQLLFSNFNTTSGTELLEGGEALMAEDFSFDGLEEMGEAAIAIAVIAGIAYGAKKVWDFFAGDPMEEYKKLLKEKESLVHELTLLINSNRTKINSISGIDNALKVKKQLSTIEAQMNEMEKTYLFRTSGTQSLSYYIVEQKFNVLSQENSMYDMSNNLDLSINRISSLKELLQKTKKISYPELIQSMKNVYNNSGKSLYNEISTLLIKAKITKKEEAIGYLKILIANEINYVSKVFNEIFKNKQELQPLYVASRNYIKHQNKITKEYKKLKDEGHV